MTTRIYEHYLCSDKTTGELVRKFVYFKNNTPYTYECRDITNAQESYFEHLRSTGNWRGELILDDSTTTTMPYAEVGPEVVYSIPKDYVCDDNTVRIGNRMFLTDMTLEEFHAGEEAWMAGEHLDTEYQNYQTGLDQMRNDPDIVWHMDWTLVSTTP